MEDIKTEWLYYVNKYKYVLGKSKLRDKEYLITLPDRASFLEYLKKCPTEEFIFMMVNIFKDKYPNENGEVFANLSQNDFRELNDIESLVDEINYLYNLISYTITFKEEQPEILTIIQNVLSDKQVTTATQDDQTVFTVMNSPIKELIVSSKRLTLNVNEDSIDIALANQ